MIQKDAEVKVSAAMFMFDCDKIVLDSSRDIWFEHAD